MKHLFFSVALVSTMLGFGQASGNLNYQNRGRNSLNNNDYSLDFPTNYEMVVSAKGLANIKADAFVAIFSVVQVGKSAEEATSLMSQRLSPVLSTLKAKNMEAFVDMISFVPMYEYETEKKVFSKRTYNEVPMGFELKQNLHIKINEASRLNELITLLTNNEIYDLVRMDYYSSQLETIKKELKDKVKSAFAEKQKLYETTLGESFASTEKKIIDGFFHISPTEQYSSYEAYSSASLQGKRAGNVVQANKSTTQYYQPIANRDFDVVLNPI
ncbi:SIMPL domain-containing protein, partial [uncultured Capnocytophaga sp.]|uniref:SIMPL domain-containing protein n=1 Tax=uncultured Capnocytophaga sp. TaxID=159273 RepID=UPI0026179E03